MIERIKDFEVIPFLDSGTPKLRFKWTNPASTERILIIYNDEYISSNHQFYDGVVYDASGNLGNQSYNKSYSISNLGLSNSEHYHFSAFVSDGNEMNTETLYGDNADACPADLSKYAETYNITTELVTDSSGSRIVIRGHHDGDYSYISEVGVLVSESEYIADENAADDTFSVTNFSDNFSVSHLDVSANQDYYYTVFVKHKDTGNWSLGLVEGKNTGTVSVGSYPVLTNQFFGAGGLNQKTKLLIEPSINFYSDPLNISWDSNSPFSKDWKKSSKDKINVNWTGSYVEIHEPA